MTTAWGIAGGFEHFWTPALRTSIHGSYIGVSYNATANTLICASQATTTAGGTVINGANTISFISAGASGFQTCNNNWNVWQIGSRTQWNVTKDFYMGVDVAYYKLETASAGAVVSYSRLGGSAQPTGLRRVADQEAAAVRVRWHRDMSNDRQRLTAHSTTTPGGLPPGVFFCGGRRTKLARGRKARRLGGLAGADERDDAGDQVRARSGAARGPGPAQ